MLVCSVKAGQGGWKRSSNKKSRNTAHGRNHKGLMPSLGRVKIFVCRPNISPEDTEALKWWLVCLPVFAFPGLARKAGVAFVDKLPASCLYCSLGNVLGFCFHGPGKKAASKV